MKIHGVVDAGNREVEGRTLPSRGGNDERRDQQHEERRESRTETFSHSLPVRLRAGDLLLIAIRGGSAQLRV
jgi:hypothetical protein